MGRRPFWPEFAKRAFLIFFLPPVKREGDKKNENAANTQQRRELKDG
jgi:hypothetical protein